jgi:hypothetical protein
MPDGYQLREAERAEPAAPRIPQFRDFRFAEQFLIWSVRKWVDIMRTDEKDPAILREAFEQAKIGDVFDAFDYMMRVVAVSARRTLDVRCVQCKAVSLDETMALGMVEAGQRGDAVSAHMYLDDWLPASAARIAYGPVVHVAEAMDRAGMRLTGNRDRHLGLRFERALH